MLRISVKGRVLLTFKDFIFIIAWLTLLLFIADAFAGQARIASYFTWVWYILGIVYIFKVIDNYNLQKNKEPETKIPAKKFFEA